MSHWQIEQRYGYGAASLPLCAVTAQRRVEPRRLRETLHEWHRDGSPARTARDFARVLSPPVLAAVAMLAVLFLVDRRDQAGVTIVPFQPLPEPVQQIAKAPEPEPPPEIVTPEPRPEPRPEPVVPEPPPQVAETRPTPPPPPPPAPAQPRPQIERLAASEPAPAPEPARSVARRERPELHTPPPALALDPLRAETPEPAPRPERATRPFAVARAERPAPAVGPAPSLAAPTVPEPAPTTRVARARPAAPRRSAPPAAPNLAAPPSLPDRSPTPVPAPARRTVAARAPERRRGSSRRRASVALPGVEPVGPAAPRRSAPARVRPEPAPVATASRAARPDDAPRIPGVSLGSLAPCVSDSRELALKQRVVAAVGRRTSCESPAGRFHFVETKNVNAFLMGIERAPHRRSGDRCTELTFALDCLSARSQRSRR